MNYCLFCDELSPLGVLKRELRFVQRIFFEETNGPKLPFSKENKIEIAIFRPQVLAFGSVSSIA